MTDTSKREELIRAVQAVTWNASNYPPKIQPHVLGQDIVPLTMKIVDAVEAVFEQAHTPSFAEALESLPTPAGCSGIGLPTDDEREALIRVLADARSEDDFDLGEFIGDLPLADAILAAGFRRTVQGEPTDAQVREEVDRREEYAEAHGHPAFQDEGSAFIDGAEWMRAALRAAHEEGKKR